jgi:hypothetical protein
MIIKGYDFFSPILLIIQVERKVLFRFECDPILVFDMTCHFLPNKFCRAVGAFKLFGA